MIFYNISIDDHQYLK